MGKKKRVQSFQRAKTRVPFGGKPFIPSSSEAACSQAQGHRGGSTGASPWCHRAKLGWHPGPVAGSSQGHVETNNHSHTQRSQAGNRARNPLAVRRQRQPLQHRCFHSLSKFPQRHYQPENPFTSFFFFLDQSENQGFLPCQRSQ